MTARDDRMERAIEHASKELSDVILGRIKDGKGLPDGDETVSIVVHSAEPILIGTLPTSDSEEASSEITDDLITALVTHRMHGRGLTPTAPDTCACGESITISMDRSSPVEARRAQAFAEHQSAYIRRSVDDIVSASIVRRLEEEADRNDGPARANETSTGFALRMVRVDVLRKLATNQGRAPQATGAEP